MLTTILAAAATTAAPQNKFGFVEALGVQEKVISWDIPLPANAVEYAQNLIPDARPTLVISPCSSHSLRNWRAERNRLVPRQRG